MGKQNKSNRKKSGSGINKIVMRKGRPSLLLTVTRHAPTIVFIGLLGFLYFWLQTKSPKITDDMIVQQLAILMDEKDVDLFTEYPLGFTLFAVYEKKIIPASRPHFFRAIEVYWDNVNISETKEGALYLKIPLKMSFDEEPDLINANVTLPQNPGIVKPLVEYKNYELVAGFLKDDGVALYGFIADNSR